MWKKLRLPLALLDGQIVLTATLQSGDSPFASDQARSCPPHDTNRQIGTGIEERTEKAGHGDGDRDRDREIDIGIDIDIHTDIDIHSYKIKIKIQIYRYRYRYGLDIDIDIDIDAEIHIDVIDIDVNIDLQIKIQKLTGTIHKIEFIYIDRWKI